MYSSHVVTYMYIIFELILAKTKTKDIQNVLSTRQHYIIERKKHTPNYDWGFYL